MDIVTPVGRFVQGSLSLETKKDPGTGQPKMDAKTGLPIQECFIGLAIRKDDPALPAMFAALTATARAEFPHLFDANGNCLRADFAWKFKDGDGVGSDGKPLSTRPGFAGCYVFSCNSRFLPKAFHAGKYDAMQEIQNAKDVVKRGYYIRLSLRISGNGVTPQDRTQKPGLFLSPNLVSFEAFGEEITSGPDAQATFGAAPAVGALPPGASATPLAGSAPMGVPQGLPPAALPPMGVPQGLPPAALPPMGVPQGLPPMPGAALPPPPAAGPVYTMTASAMGATREQWKAQGWTDEALVAAGHMVITG
jgi:hypothetical protein